MHPEKINFRVFAQNFQRPFVVFYDPYTESIEVVRKMQDLKDAINRFKSELSSFTEAVEILNKNIANKWVILSKIQGIYYE